MSGEREDNALCSEQEHTMVTTTHTRKVNLQTDDSDPEHSNESIHSHSEHREDVGDYLELRESLTDNEIAITEVSEHEKGTINNENTKTEASEHGDGIVGNKIARKEGSSECRDPASQIENAVSEETTAYTLQDYGSMDEVLSTSYSVASDSVDSIARGFEIMVGELLDPVVSRLKTHSILASKQKDVKMNAHSDSSERDVFDQDKREAGDEIPAPRDLSCDSFEVEQESGRNIITGLLDNAVTTTRKSLNVFTDDIAAKHETVNELLEAVVCNTIVLDAFFPEEAAKLDEENLMRKQLSQERKETRDNAKQIQTRKKKDRRAKKQRRKKKDSGTPKEVRIKGKGSSKETEQRREKTDSATAARKRLSKRIEDVSTGLLDAVANNTIVLDGFFPEEAAKLEEETTLKKQKLQEMKKERLFQQLLKRLEQERVLEIMDDLKASEEQTDQESC